MLISFQVFRYVIKNALIEWKSRSYIKYPTSQPTEYNKRNKYRPPILEKLFYAGPILIFTYYTTLFITT
jgi:hypothetical protein